MLTVTRRIVLKVKLFKINPDKSDIDLVYFGGFQTNFVKYAGP